MGFGKGTEFEYLSNYVFHLNSETPAMTRFSAGFLIREMLQHFKDKIESKLSPDRSLWLYSAHDLTIATVLNGLGLFEVISNLHIRCGLILMEYLFSGALSTIYFFDSLRTLQDQKRSLLANILQKHKRRASIAIRNPKMRL